MAVIPKTATVIIKNKIMSEKTMRKFMRRNPEYGTAYIAVGEKTIKIDGREIYSTKDKAEIAVLSVDPEIIEDKTIDAEVEEVAPDAPKKI